MMMMTQQLAVDVVELNDNKTDKIDKKLKVNSCET